jgi:putative tryptophan/tyrosine transport system substrate-binding protein
VVSGFVDKILKGARPAHLPVQQPPAFEFILNMQTAQSIGVSIPVPIQLLASRVIE